MGRDLNLGSSSLLPTYLTNQPTTLSTTYGFSSFFFLMNSVHWTYIIFRNFHVLNWHILGRLCIEITNYQLKIKNHKNCKKKIWKNFQIFKIGLKLSQIFQFMEKYLKIGIFFTLRKKKFPREKLKKFQSFRN